MEKQVGVGNQTYNLATIRVGQAKTIQFSGKKGLDFNLAIVEASLRAAGDESVVDDIPFFGGFSNVLDAALEVNGLKKAGGSDSRADGTGFDIGWIYGSLARWHGYTFDQIDAMLLTDFFLLDDFMAQHPPADILIAGYLQYKRPKKATSGSDQKSVDAARVNAGSFSFDSPLMRKSRVHKIGEMPAHIRESQSIQNIIAKMSGKTALL